MYLSDADVRRVADELYFHLKRHFAGAGSSQILPAGGNPANSSGGVPRRLLTIQEAARYMGRTKNAVEHLINKGGLRGCLVRKDRRVFIDRVALDKWIETHRS